MTFNYLRNQTRKRRNFILNASRIVIKIGNKEIPTKITIMKNFEDGYYNCIYIIPKSKNEESFWINFFDSLFRENTFIIREPNQNKKKRKIKCNIM